MAEGSGGSGNRILRSTRDALVKARQSKAYKSTRSKAKKKQIVARAAKRSNFFAPSGKAAKPSKISAAQAAARQKKTGRPTPVSPNARKATKAAAKRRARRTIATVRKQGAAKRRR